MSSTPSNLTVEIVNDSGNDDSSVFLLLTGDSVAVTGSIQWLQLPQASGSSITAGALNLLSQQGTLVSPYTGQTLNIYQFTVDTLTSGRLWVSFGTGLTYSDNAAPTSTGETMRWDTFEFGYPASAADLTSINLFGIPMQFEYLDGNGNVLTSMSFYTSTPTLLTSLYSLSPATMATAFQQYSEGALSFGWNPTTDSLATFLRVIGPQTFTGGSSGSPAPYPSFSGYLAALEAAGTTFTISGIGGVGVPAPPNNSVTYDYTGTVASDGNGGYVVTFTGTTTAVPPNTSDGPYGLNSSGAAAQLPANLSVTLALTADTFDNDIYGAVATAVTVGQSTDPDAPDYIDSTLLPYTANSAYANLAGDFIAGLNFGYPGGTDGSNSAVWYSNPPTPYPFAGARATNDGYYNPYAAVLYNQSDAYGFPFSDRNGRPSPLVPQPADATTLRITILNDQRLDAPQVTVTQPAEVTLTWPAVYVPSGATLTGYTLDISPSVSGWNSSLAAGTLTVTPGPLAAGTPYTFTLTAQGTAAGGQAISSGSTVVTATTGGTAVSPSGSYTFDVALTWTPLAPPPTGTVFTVAGVALTPTIGNQGGTNATVSGSAGLNVLPLVIQNGAETLYAGTYSIYLIADGDGDGYNADPHNLSVLNGNTQPLAIQGTPPFTTDNPLVIGTPFAPAPGKQVNPVVFPSDSSGS